MIIRPLSDSGIYKRCFSYLCEYCLSNEFSKCLYINHETFRDNLAVIKPQWDVLKKKKELIKKRVKKNAQNIDSNDSEEKIEYVQTGASSFIKLNSINVIRTGDDFPYYLVKLKKDSFLTDGNTKDDCGKTFPPMTKVTVGHYYEYFKSKRVTYII